VRQHSRRDEKEVAKAAIAATKCQKVTANGDAASMPGKNGIAEASKPVAPSGPQHLNAYKTQELLMLLQPLSIGSMTTSGIARIRSIRSRRMMHLLSQMDTGSLHRKNANSSSHKHCNPREASSDRFEKSKTNDTGQSN